MRVEKRGDGRLPGTHMAGVSPVPAQMWQRWTQCRQVRRATETCRTECMLLCDIDMCVGGTPIALSRGSADSENLSNEQ